MRTESLTIELEAFDADRALSAWRWRLPDTHRPFAISLFGDWLLEATDGGVYMMDTLEAQVIPLAATRAQFHQQVEQNEDCRDDWLMEGFVLGQASRGTVLRAGQCFGFKVPPILGAPIEAENIQPCEIVGYELFLGELHRKLHDVPPGGRIDQLTIDDELP